MDKVSKLVREMMLVYPTLCPSRQAALYSIFTDSGTNYVWNRKGCIVVAHEMDKDFEGPIDISDLARSDEQFDGDHDFNKMIRIENELERRERLYRAEHIDLYCQYGRGGDYGYRQLDQYLLDKMEGDYGVATIFRAPFGKIDPEWAHAAETFINDMMVAFNMVYHLQWDHPLGGEKAPDPSMYSRMPEVMQRRYDNLKAVADKLEAQTGNRARRAEFTKRVLADLKAEQAA